MSVKLTKEERRVVALVLSGLKPNLDGQLWFLQFGDGLFYVRQDWWPICEVYGWLRNLENGQFSWVHMGSKTGFRQAQEFLRVWLGWPKLMHVNRLEAQRYSIVRNYLGEVWAEFPDVPGRWEVPGFGSV